MDILTFLAFIAKDMSPGQMLENLSVALTIFFVAKRYFSKKADEVTDAIKEVKAEMHSLNVKVGDVAQGLDMAKKSYEDRFRKIEHQNVEMMGEVLRLKNLIEPVLGDQSQQIIAP